MMNSLEQPTPAYQPAHSGLHKGAATTYEFDSPATIAKQQQSLQQQQFLPAGGFQQAGSGLQQQSDFSQANVFGSQSQIPTPPPLPMWGFKKNTRSRQINLRTRDWGRRSSNGWSNFNSQAVTQESFLKKNSRIPPAPKMRPLSYRRTWTRGPYVQPTLRTHSWGNRTRQGWTNWNRNSYQRGIESIDTRQSQFWREAYLADKNGQSQSGSDSSRGLDSSQQLGNQQFSGQQLDQQFSGQQGNQQFSGQQLDQQFSGQQGNQQFSSLPGNQQFSSLQGNQFSGQQLGNQQFSSLQGNQFSGQQLGNQQYAGQQLGGQQYGNTSALPTIISSAPISAAPLGNSGLYANQNNGLNQNANGKKLGRRQRKKLAKQASIGQQLNTRLAPPIGDPAVNHYRRGAPESVPLAGPAIAGQQTGKGLFSRRRGRKNNLGPRRARRGARTGGAPGRVLPVPATQPPIVAPIPMAQAPISTTSYSTISQPLYQSQSGISQSGLYQSQPLYSSGIQQQQFGQKQNDLLQQQAINRPTGYATF